MDETEFESLVSSLKESFIYYLIIMHPRFTAHEVDLLFFHDPAYAEVLKNKKLGNHLINAEIDKIFLFSPHLLNR